MNSVEEVTLFSCLKRDSRYATNSNVETAMGLNRRPSLLAGYHNPFTSPERFVSRKEFSK